MTYCIPAEVNCTSIDRVQRWIPHGFADRPVYELIEAGVLSRKRIASGAVGADRLYATRAVVWKVTFDIWCSLAAANAYMRLSSRVDPEVTDTPCFADNFRYLNCRLRCRRRVGFIRYTIVWQNRCSLELLTRFHRHLRQVRRVCG